MSQAPNRPVLASSQTTLAWAQSPPASWWTPAMSGAETAELCAAAVAAAADDDDDTEAEDRVAAGFGR